MIWISELMLHVSIAALFVALVSSVWREYNEVADE